MSGAGKGATFWTAVGSIAAVAALVWGVYTFAATTSDMGPSDSTTTIPYPDGTPQSPKPHPLTLFTGEWTGDIVQFSPSTRYNATLVIAIPTAGQIVGTSSYPSLECSGNLRLVGVSDKVLRVEELITEGKAVPFGTKGCVNGFIILELLPDGRLFYRFTDKNNSNAASLGEGFLIRK